MNLMGVSLDVYRVVIGRFNSLKIGRRNLRLFARLVSGWLIYFIAFLTMLSILQAGDVEVNPGPAGPSRNLTLNVVMSMLGV